MTCTRAVVLVATAAALTGCSDGGGRDDRPPPPIPSSPTAFPSGAPSGLPTPTRRRPAQPSSIPLVRGVSYARAELVMHRHTTEIWHLSTRVTGVGAGSVCRRTCPRDRSFGIIVMVQRIRDLRLPRTIDGVPVRFQVSGLITPQAAAP